MPKFKVGDGIKRRSDVFDDKSPYLKGEIVRVYSDIYSIHGYYPELYEVEWHNADRIEKGFLPHGLEPYTE